MCVFVLLLQHLDMNNKGNKHQISVRYIFICEQLGPTRRMRNVCKYISSILLVQYYFRRKRLIVRHLAASMGMWVPLSLSLCLCVCLCVWLGLISHNKSNWLLIGYIWKKWNAQSLLISHFSHLLKQETSNERRPKETNKKLMKSSWTGRGGERGEGT